MLDHSMAKKKAKRYSDDEKKEIMDFIEAHGRGGQTVAVKKFKVTAATLAAWKKKSGHVADNRSVSSGSSKELKALQNLTSILIEIEQTEAKLQALQKRYKVVKSNI